MLLSPYGAALTPVDGGKKFAEWRGHLFTDFAQLILYSLLFAVFILVFSSLDVLTDDFFDFLSDHSSILDNPPLELDSATVEQLITSFYQVGIIIGSVFALATLPALFGGILGQINALAGAGMMRRGMMMATGIPLAKAAGRGLKKIGSKAAKGAASGTKEVLQEKMTEYKNSEGTISKKNKRAFNKYQKLSDEKRAENKTRADRAYSMARNKGINLKITPGRLKTPDQIQEEMIANGISQADAKAFAFEVRADRRTASSDGSFNKTHDNAYFKDTKKVQQKVSTQSKESEERLNKNAKGRKKEDPTLK